MASFLERGFFVRTKNETHNFRLIWTIENFLDYPAKVKSCLRSPPFSCTSGTDYGMEFYLKIFPRGDTVESKEFVSSYLRIDELPKIVNDVQISFDISLIDLRNKKAKTKCIESSEHLLFDDFKGGRGWRHFINREDLRKNAKEWLPDGHLTLECNVKVHFQFKNPVSTVVIHSEAGLSFSSD